jgi:DNA invertase Pin-like site-specific DNA recombinase/DNA-binding winged helix-turn-helix (wHTH) protein
MPSQPLTPAAEYVRMSTDDQQNSIPIQQAAIQQYATQHGYEIVATYADMGKSGLAIKTRPGLRQLLQDVVGGQSRFRAILVYDVSRWGRFQDTDESAHYEFLCRSAGVPIHYCAEQFENDGKLPNAIMKALKRTMAAEYSRELAAKVSAGARRTAAQGYRIGGTAGFGMRRMIVSADGRRRQILRDNERKNIKSDRIILVPGPKREVNCIRTIFDLAANERMAPRQIVKELNRRKLSYIGDGAWDDNAVYRILKNEKYMGYNVWGKTVRPFNRDSHRVPRSAWIIKPDAFVPIVSVEQFTRVQKLIQRRRNWPKRPDEYLLNGMRRVLAREGRLTEKLLTGRGIFDHRTYCKRFGSVLRAYQLVGYQPSIHAFKSVDNLRKMKRLRSELLIRLKELFPSNVRIIQRCGQSQRRAIELDNSLQIVVHICRPVRPTLGGEPRWLLIAQPRESGVPALICFADKNMSQLISFYVVPEFGQIIRRYKVLREGHPWLAAGKRLESLSQFHEVAREVTLGWRPHNEVTVVGDVLFTARTSTITIAGKEILLARIDAAIFKLLVTNAGHVVSREKLCRCGDGPKTLFVTAHVSELRRKLGKQFRKRIVTVKGVGYMYEMPREGHLHLHENQSEFAQAQVGSL